MVHLQHHFTPFEWLRVKCPRGRSPTLAMTFARVASCAEVSSRCDMGHKAEQVPFCLRGHHGHERVAPGLSAAGRGAGQTGSGKAREDRSIAICKARNIIISDSELCKCAQLRIIEAAGLVMVDSRLVDVLHPCTYIPVHASSGRSCGQAGKNSAIVCADVQLQPKRR